MSVSLNIQQAGGGAPAARPRPEAPRPHAIITSGEVLTADNRTLIESTFGCKVYNRYGCREFAVIASECGHLGQAQSPARDVAVKRPSVELEELTLLRVR